MGGWPHQEGQRENESIRFLTGLQSLQGHSTAWTHAFAIAGSAPADTWSSDNPYVAPFAAAIFGQPRHRRRIDDIFVGSAFGWEPGGLRRHALVVATAQCSISRPSRIRWSAPAAHGMSCRSGERPFHVRRRGPDDEDPEGCRSIHR